MKQQEKTIHNKQKWKKTLGIGIIIIALLPLCSLWLLPIGLKLTKN